MRRGGLHKGRSGKSILRRLPPERQAEIAEYGAAHTLSETVEWLARQGIKLSLSAVSRYLTLQRLTTLLEGNALTVELLVEKLAKHKDFLTPERLQELGQLFFAELSLQKNDARIWKLAQDIQIKRERLQLDWSKHREQIDLRKSAIQQKLDQAKANGGISAETLQQIEQQLNLM